MEANARYNFDAITAYGSQDNRTYTSIDLAVLKNVQDNSCQCPVNAPAVNTMTKECRDRLFQTPSLAVTPSDMLSIIPDLTLNFLMASDEITFLGPETAAITWTVSASPASPPNFVDLSNFLSSQTQTTPTINHDLIEDLVEYTFTAVSQYDTSASYKYPPCPFLQMRLN